MSAAMFVALFNELSESHLDLSEHGEHGRYSRNCGVFHGNWRSSPIISVVCSVCFHIFSMKKLIKTSIYGGDFPWKLIKTSIYGGDFPSGHVWWHRVVTLKPKPNQLCTQREPRRGVVNASRRGDPRSQLWRWSGLYGAKLVWLSRYIYIYIYTILYIYIFITRLDLTTVVGDLNIS